MPTIAGMSVISANVLVFSPVSSKTSVLFATLTSCTSSVTTTSNVYHIKQKFVSAL